MSKRIVRPQDLGSTRRAGANSSAQGLLRTATVLRREDMTVPDAKMASEGPRQDEVEPLIPEGVEPAETPSVLLQDIVDLFACLRDGHGIEPHPYGEDEDPEMAWEMSRDGQWPSASSASSARLGNQCISTQVVTDAGSPGRSRGS